MMMPAHAKLVVLAAACFAATARSLPQARAPSAAPPTATIPGLGKLVGAPSPIDPAVAVFNGIPYAKSPEGPLRWRPPQVHGPWAPKTRNATAFGPMCRQSGWGAPSTGTAEDCLYLNIQTPQPQQPGARLPVMFWIHGGGYTTGASNGYAGDSIVHQSGGSVVVVTINYRLNIFGFLGGSEISASTDGGGSGNFGIQDQRAAMVWVKANIAAFGKCHYFSLVLCPS
eukprot:SAG22_NODE_18_length_32591_cov_38.043549_15_plen_227_part_00